MPDTKIDIAEPGDVEVLLSRLDEKAFTRSTWNDDALLESRHEQARWAVGIRSLLDQLEQSQREVESAEAKGWRDAVSAVQYMVANWTQDRRDPVEHKALIDAGKGLVEELVSASPGEWLGTEWLSVQDWTAKLNASQSRVAELTAEVERLKGTLAKIAGANVVRDPWLDLCYRSDTRDLAREAIMAGD